MSDWARWAVSAVECGRDIRLWRVGFGFDGDEAEALDQQRADLGLNLVDAIAR